MSDISILPISDTSSPRLAQLLRLWGHVQHELIYVAWALMEMALLTPLALALMPWARFWPPGQALAWLLLLMLLAYNSVRLLALLALPPDRQRALMALMLLALLFFVVRTLVHTPQSLFDFGWVRQFWQDVMRGGSQRWWQDVSLFVLIVFVWIRGVRLVGREAQIDAIGLRLRVGGLLVAPLVIFLGSRQLVWDVTPYLLLFLLAGLTAVALIRAEEVEKQRSAKSASLNPRWLLLILLAALLTILSAGLLATVISGGKATAVVGWLAPIVISIQYLVSISLSTVLYLAIPILETIDWIILTLGGLIQSIILFGRHGFMLLQKLTAKLMTSVPAAVPENGNVGPAPSTTPGFLGRVIELGDIGRFSNVLVLLLILAVVLLVALSLSGKYAPTQVSDRRSGRVRPRSRSRKNLGTRLLEKLGLWQNWRTAASIRRIYRHMLDAADGAGFPRLESETPYEYLQTLQQVWPTNLAQTQLITMAYVKIRYGELPETQAELDEIIHAWEVLEATPPETAVVE